METPTPADPQGQDCPQCGYCVSGSAKQGRCPECGSTLTHWTTRWRASDVVSGLEMLAWGLPLLLVAVGAATVSRLYGVGSSVAVAVLSRVTLTLCLVPGALCLLGAIQLRMAQRLRLWSVVLPAVFVVTCIVSTSVSGANRNWLTKSVAGTYALFAGPEHPLGTVVATLGFLGAIWVASCASATVASLGREFQLNLRLLRLGSVALLWVSIGIPIVDDSWRYLVYEGPTSVPGPGSTPAANIRGMPQGIGRFDAYGHCAAVLGILALWALALLVRARMKWDLRRDPV